MMMDLPTVVMIEILSRLTIKSIFRCKIVCKLWYLLLTSDPLFINMYHLKRSSDFPSILLSINESVRLLVELKADDSHPIHRAIVLSPMFHLPSPKFSWGNMTLIGSCNRFLCLLSGRRYDIDHRIYISNPILGEYFEVKLPEWEKKNWRVSYAFCFSKASGQFKVLRSIVTKSVGSPEVSELEVYTLGANEKWKNVGKAPEPLCGLFSKVNINGVIHWMGCKNNENIYSFNSFTEEVKSLSTPRGLQTPLLGLTLGELGNCLCLSDDSNNQYIDIWWMKEYGIVESWTKQRILKDSIQAAIRGDKFIPILLWKDGEILMQRDLGTQLVSYNPKENKFTKVKVYGGTGATSYTPCFYSLKTVIGECFQVSYAFPKIELV
uniref:F-box family protein n=2 Tax=Solanum tuberosum TaxID=4113 RepID=M1DXD9_SOLTU